jgi:hypothetical protein
MNIKIHTILNRIYIYNLVNINELLYFDNFFIINCYKREIKYCKVISYYK